MNSHRPTDSHPGLQPTAWQGVALALLAGWLALCAGAVRASETGGDLRSFGERWTQQLLAQSQGAATADLRMEVSIGDLDPRLNLAPCARIESYLPAGTRLWGRSRIGLRCTDAAVRWNVFLPVTVRAFGAAWVLRRPVAAGETLQEEDAERAEVDWAAAGAPVVALPQQWVGQTAAYTLAAGTALRQNMLRPPQAFGSGAQVRVVVQGEGFAITTDAQALAPGFLGQTVRVRTESGRIIGGTVLDARTVRVGL